MQPQVTELAGRLLPQVTGYKSRFVVIIRTCACSLLWSLLLLLQITTIEIGPDVLGGSNNSYNLLAWRQDMQLASADHGGAAATQAATVPSQPAIAP